MSFKIKLKKGDEVMVISGKDKGKTGKINIIKPKDNKAIVSGINKVKKHQKPDNNQPGGITEKEMPIHLSNLAYYDASSKKPVKLGFSFNKKKEKIQLEEEKKHKPSKEIKKEKSISTSITHNHPTRIYPR